MGTKFTPGPWTYYPKLAGSKCGIVTEPMGGHMAEIRDSRPQWYGNAILIAAAPTMFAELEAIRQLANDAMEGNDSIGAVKEIITRADAAITKATGPA